MNNVLENIKLKINTKDSFQPILFLSGDENKINYEISNLINNLIDFYKVDKNCVYKIVNNGESIKIADLRAFISKSNIKSSFLFQIFLIEDISRFTLESANLSLKFLEEPGNGNIIFLTSKTQSGILETILSRVKIIDIFGNSDYLKNDFYFNLITDFLNKKNIDLITYFFKQKKLTKNDYIEFFKTFLFYIKQNLKFSYLVEDIEKSLNLIQKNNVLPKYEIDKLLLKLNYETN